MAFRHIGGDDGRCFGQAIALKHGDADGIVETLHVDIQQRAAADEEQQTSAKVFADFAEQELVVEHHHRFEQQAAAFAAIDAEAIVLVGGGQGFFKQLDGARPFGANAFFDVLAEILRQGGHAEQKGRPGLFDIERNVLQSLHGGLADLHRRHGRAVAHQGVDAGHVGKGMIPRKDQQRAIPLRDGQQRVGLFHIGSIVAVGQHDALGVRGGA
ncbi:MAG: hypothetical protein BWY83_02977 [bacterium ADurb.Bin478]|nr:MAG: hypothetical protein BWY83_02977 [bacterium ADurb.Bin478]